MTQTNWCVLTGGPSSGITSLGNYLRLCGFSVVPECARSIVDLGRSLGLSTEEVRKDQIHYERQILKLQTQIESELPADDLVFIERGIIDPVAYGISNEEVDRHHHFTYKHVFMLERVSYQQDYARIETEDEARKIELDIKAAYQHFSYQSIPIKKTVAS